MNQEEILSAMSKALAKVTERNVSFTMDTDLVKEKIIDSLDSAVFLLEMERLTNREIPDEQVFEKDLFKVGNLVTYLTTH